MTDGQENSSVEFIGEDGRLSVKSMVERETKENGWQFVFMGANIDAPAVGGSLGVHASNAACYDASATGTEAVYKSMSRGVSRSRERFESVLKDSGREALVIPSFESDFFADNSPVIQDPADTKSKK